MSPNTRRRRAILRNRRRGYAPVSWLTAPDPFKVGQGLMLIIPSEEQLFRSLFGKVELR